MKNSQQQADLRGKMFTDLNQPNSNVRSRVHGGDRVTYFFNSPLVLLQECIWSPILFSFFSSVNYIFYDKASYGKRVIEIVPDLINVDGTFCGRCLFGVCQIVLFVYKDN